MTDLIIENQYLKAEYGIFTVEEAFLCVSLTEHNDGYAYKPAAAIITPDRAK